jgi:hypothetical protein
VSGGFASDPLSDIDVSFGPDALSDVDVSLTCGGDPDTDTERGNDGKSGLCFRLGFRLSSKTTNGCVAITVASFSCGPRGLISAVALQAARHTDEAALNHRSEDIWLLESFVNAMPEPMLP